MTVAIRCADYGCTRPATMVVLRPMYEKGDEPPTLDALRCNVHVGALKRTKWGLPAQFLPLDEFPTLRTEAEAAALKRIQDAADARRAQEAENRALAESGYKKAWQKYGNEEYIIEDDADFGPTRRGVVALVVYPAGREKAGWDTWRVTVEDPSRYDDLPKPLFVRLNSSGSFTPAAARAYAKAILVMASRVEAANLLAKPDTKE